MDMLLKVVRWVLGLFLGFTALGALFTGDFIATLVMLAGVIGTLLLCITAPILWWKRRGSRRLAPAPFADPAASRRVAAVMLIVGLALPLTGLTMLAALAGEWVWERRQA